MKELMKRKGFKNDLDFDWCEKKTVENKLWACDVYLLSEKTYISLPENLEK